MLRQGIRYRASAEGLLYPYSVARLNPNYSYVCQYIENMSLIDTRQIVTMAIYDEDNNFVCIDKFLCSHFIEYENRKSIYGE